MLSENICYQQNVEDKYVNKNNSKDSQDYDARR